LKLGRQKGKRHSLRWGKQSKRQTQTTGQTEQTTVGHTSWKTTKVGLQVPENAWLFSLWRAFPCREHQPECHSTNGASAHQKKSWICWHRRNPSTSAIGKAAAGPYWLWKYQGVNERKRWQYDYITSMFNMFIQKLLPWK
jgi:hypothetical protein